jgi:hypothetical protein
MNKIFLRFMDLFKSRDEAEIASNSALTGQEGIRCSIIWSYTVHRLTAYNMQIREKYLNCYWNQEYSIGEQRAIETETAK